MPRLRIAAMHLPPFHLLGFVLQIVYPLLSCVTIALYPPVTKRPNLLPIMATPQNILDHTQRTKPNGIMTIPSIIQIWSQDPKSVDILKSLEFVVRRPFFALGIRVDFVNVFSCIAFWWGRNFSENWRFFVLCWGEVMYRIWNDRSRPSFSSFQTKKGRRSILGLCGVL